MKLEYSSAINFLLLFKWLPFSGAMDVRSEVLKKVQLDGRSISVVPHGDESDHWLTDVDGYLVMEDGNGEYVYADESSDGNVIRGNDKVGEIDPIANGKKKGLHKKKSTNECFKKICGGIQGAPTIVNDYEECEGKKCGQGGLRGLRKTDPGPEAHDRRIIATTGRMKNLVIPLYFKDHAQAKRSVPSIEDLDVLMNSDTPNADLCPTGSIKTVYREMSYDQLTIESTVVPWFVTSKPESWYADGSSGTTNLHEALREALTYLDENNIVDFSDFDEDNDGYIDSITFLHSGYGAEWYERSCDNQDYDDRIWSHKWKLWSDRNGDYQGAWRSSDNVKVWDYHISPALWGMCGNEIGRIGVIAHELGHFLGLKDLYDTNGGGRGLGGYCLMASSWGFDEQQLNPGHMSAWAKMELGWLDAKTPTHGLNLIAKTETPSEENQLYKIGDGEHGFPNGEYLLIENRQRSGLDRLLPQGGLAIFHIDEKTDYSDEGYPGQGNWPQNGNHYKIALLQADGQYDLEKGDNKGDKRDFFHGGRVNSLMSSNDVNSGPFPNTDCYQQGKVEKTGIVIFDISDSGDTMSFSFSDGKEPDPTDVPTDVPTDGPTDGPTSVPTSDPSAGPSAGPTTAPSKSLEPSAAPSNQPTELPSTVPSPIPSQAPSSLPSRIPTGEPSISTEPSVITAVPSDAPSVGPSSLPSSLPTTSIRSSLPSLLPTSSPNLSPSWIIVDDTKGVAIACVDSLDFRYKNKDNKDCDWVAQKSWKRCRKEWEDSYLRDFCPLACDNCQDAQQVNTATECKAEKEKCSLDSECCSAKCKRNECDK